MIRLIIAEPGLSRDRKSHAAGTTDSNGRHRKSLAGIVLEAGFVTLLAIFVHKLGILDGADQFIFAKTSAAVKSLVPGISRTGDAAVAVEIDQKMFDETFGGTTPLPRKPLAKLIEVLAIDGATLAIDLDLSPRGEQLLQFHSAFKDTPLSCSDERLSAWPLEEALCGRTSKKISLLVPFPVDGTQSAITKARWMQFVCKIGGIDFAFADIPVLSGPYALDYFTGPMTLAAVSDGGRRGDTNGDQDHGSKDVASICGRIQEVPLTPDQESLPLEFVFLDRALAQVGYETLYPDHPSNQPTRRLNYLPALNVIPLSECWSEDANRCPERIRQLQAPASVIFLGGAWESYGADQFMTPLEQVPGVRLHAIALAGEMRVMGKYLGVLIEFLVGICLIPLFQGVWHRADRGLRAFVDAPGYSALRLRAGAIYVWQVLLVPIVVTVLALLILSSTAVLLSTYGWMAPTPILVSLLVKSYLERESTPYEEFAFGWWCARLPHMLFATVAVWILITGGEH